MNRAEKFRYCSSFVPARRSQLICPFSPKFISKLALVMSCFYGKGRNSLREGRSGVADVAIAQCWSRSAYTFGNARKGDGSRPWVWYTARGCGYFCGLNSGLLNEMRAGCCWRKECRIFLSEMSCGEVVAGSLLFPGRAFEFSSPGFFFSVSTPLFAVPAALRAARRWVATKDSEYSCSGRCFCSTALQQGGCLPAAELQPRSPSQWQAPLPHVSHGDGVQCAVRPH